MTWSKKGFLLSFLMNFTLWSQVNVDDLPVKLIKLGIEADFGTGFALSMNEFARVRGPFEQEKSFFSAFFLGGASIFADYRALDWLSAGIHYKASFVPKVAIHDFSGYCKLRITKLGLNQPINREVYFRIPIGVNVHGQFVPKNGYKPKLGFNTGLIVDNDFYLNNNFGLNMAVGYMLHVLRFENSNDGKMGRQWIHEAIIGMSFIWLISP